MDTRYTKKVARHWGEKPPERMKGFYKFPPLRDYIFYCVTGKEEKTERESLIRWTVEEYLSGRTPVDECLSLCCGFGEIERILAELKVFNNCTGIDLSDGAIKYAVDRAKEKGYDNIKYLVGDLHNTDLGADKYDLIYANGAFHHIEKLEQVISSVNKALKPGGILVCNEYIGPKHQKLSSRQREIINSVIHLIPQRLRYTNERTFVPTFFRSPPWKRLLFEGYRLITFQADQTTIDYTSSDLELSSHWPNYKKRLLNIYNVVRKIMPSLRREKNSFRFGKVWDDNSKRIKFSDPSECIRSDEIIPVLKKTFRNIDIRYYNGSILFYALDRKFYNEYDPNKKEDRAFLKLLTDIEKTMIESGELSSDHAHIIAKK